jgi:hypothetical protein
MEAEMKIRRGRMLAGVAVIALLAVASDIGWTTASFPNPDRLPANASIEACNTEACRSHAGSTYRPPNGGLALADLFYRY